MSKIVCPHCGEVGCQKHCSSELSRFHVAKFDTVKLETMPTNEWVAVQALCKYCGQVGTVLVNLKELDW